MRDETSENVAHIQRMNEVKMVSLLLKGFKADDFPELNMADRPSAVKQLRGLFYRLDPDAQERFKRATASALGEWSLHAHGLNALRELARLAGHIRASSAIDRLQRITESPELDGLEHDRYLDIVGVILRVLWGFVPHDAVRRCFERLYYSAQYGPDFCAILFPGLCECSPDAFEKYVPRFLQLVSSHPNRYSLKHVIGQFERAVNVTGIAARVLKSDALSAEGFLDLVCARLWSPTIAIIDPARGCLVGRRPRYSREPIMVPMSPHGDEWSAEDFAVVFGAKMREIENLGGEIALIENRMLWHSEQRTERTRV